MSCYHNPCNGYNACNQNCGTTCIVINGCICIENQTAAAVADAQPILLNLTATSPCGATGTYRAMGTTAASGGNSGGGALLNISQGACCSCAPCCNQLTLNATITIGGTNQVLEPPLTFSGCCGGTLTAITKVSGAGASNTFNGNTLTLNLNSNKQCCGSCTTCTITGGKLTIT